MGPFRLRSNSRRLRRTSSQVSQLCDFPHPHVPCKHWSYSRVDARADAGNGAASLVSHFRTCTPFIHPHYLGQLESVP